MVDQLVQLSPELPRIKEFARVLCDGELVLVKTQQINPDINKMLKRYAYEWSYPRMAWWHRVAPALGGTDHAAAEMATLLLSSGYPVEIEKGISALVMSGEFEPEARRWIKAHEGRFIICWRKPEDCYKLALTLPSARYAPPYVATPGIYYDEVMDFADVHNFKVLGSATKLEAEERAKRESVIFFTPDVKQSHTKEAVNEFAIPDELKDSVA